MEQQYRYLLCKKCQATLQVETFEKQIGEELNFECPTCGNEFKIIIWKRPSMDGLIDKLIEAAWRAVAEGNHLTKPISDAIELAGFKAKLQIDVTTEPILEAQLPEPKVYKGVVEQGVYTEKDKKTLKEMKISFEEEE